MPTVTANDLERFTLDGTLDLHTGGLALEAVSFTPPRKKYDRVSSAERDGTALVREPRYEDREVELKVRVVQTATMDLALTKLGAITGKLQEADRLAVTGRGMTATWTPANGTTQLTLYVKGGEVEALPVDVESGYFVRSPTVTVKLVCDPFLYGDWVEGTATSASTPIVTHTISGVAGDVPAEAVLTISDTASVGRAFAEWGLEQRDFNVSADLILEGADLITTGFEGTSQTNSAAYNSNVVRYASVTQAPLAFVGTGTLPHVGEYLVKARVFSSEASGSSTGRVRLTWRAGLDDYRSNPYAVVPGGSEFYEVNLGYITIGGASVGTQRWDGRLEAYRTGTTGLDLEVDYLLLIPVKNGYGKALSLPSTGAPTTYNLLDGFETATVGNLATRTADKGGTWAGAGDVDDFQTGSTAGALVGSYGLARSVNSDSAITNGRFSVLGATNYAGTVAEIRTKRSAISLNNGLRCGLLLRYTDTSNWLVAHIVNETVQDTGAFGYNSGVTPSATFVVTQMVAGAATTLARSANLAWQADAIYKIVATVNADGTFSATLYTIAGNDPETGAEGSGAATSVATLSGYKSTLATGGSLASGKVGIYDAYLGTGSPARYYDAFQSYSPEADYAIFSGRDLRVGSYETVRSDSAGTYYGRPDTYRGSRFWLPPAGEDNYPSRLVARATRTDVEAGTPSLGVTDATSVQIAHRPRYLNAPRA